MGALFGQSFVYIVTRHIRRDKDFPSLPTLVGEDKAGVVAKRPAWAVAGSRLPPQYLV